jgi:hypothetical protein
MPEALGRGDKGLTKVLSYMPTLWGRINKHTGRGAETYAKDKTCLHSVVCLYNRTAQLNSALGNCSRVI